MKLLGTCVGVTIVARSVGPATASHQVTVNVPYAKEKSFLEHAKHAWDSALAGKFPATTRDREALKDLATNHGQWARAPFAPFTPSHMQGPTSVTWDMFASTLSVHGSLLGEVRDESFDWNVDCAVLSGDIAAAALPLGDLDLSSSFSGTLFGARILDHTIPAEAILEVSGESVQGELPSESIPSQFVRRENIASLHASKITPPATWTDAALSQLPALDSLLGTAKVESLPMEGLRMGQGISMSCATGSVSPDQIPAGAVLGRHVMAIAGDRISGGIDGSRLMPRSLAGISLVGEVDAGVVQGDVDLPDNRVASARSVVQGTLACTSWTGCTTFRSASAVAQYAACTSFTSQGIISTPHVVAIASNASMQRLACENLDATSLQCDDTAASRVNADRVFTRALESGRAHVGLIRASSRIAFADAKSAICTVLDCEVIRMRATYADISKTVACESLRCDRDAHTFDFGAVRVECEESTVTGDVTALRASSPGVLCRKVAADCLNVDAMATSGVDAQLVSCRNLQVTLGCSANSVNVLGNTECDRASAGSTEVCNGIHTGRIEAHVLHASTHCSVSRFLKADSISCGGSTHVHTSVVSARTEVRDALQSSAALTRSTRVLDRATCSEVHMRSMSCVELLCPGKMEAGAVNARKLTTSPSCLAKCYKAASESVHAHGLVCKNAVMRSDAKSQMLTVSQARSGTLLSRVVHARSGCAPWIHKLTDALKHLRHMTSDV